MLIPFIMLLIITIALILERKFQEDEIHKIYKEKFENWKKHQKNDDKVATKELVGLVYMQEYQLSIELLDNKAFDPLQRKRYDIKPVTKDNNENIDNTSN
jgi:hypothetical protein